MTRDINNHSNFDEKSDTLSIIDKVDKIGDSFQSNLLVSLMANSLRLENMKENDLYLYNLEVNSRFGGIVGLHCVAAQEQMYTKLSKNMNLDFGIIPQKIASCLYLKKHFEDNYSQGEFEGCVKDVYVYRDEESLNIAKNIERQATINKYIHRYEQNNIRKPLKEEINKEKYRFGISFDKKNMVINDVNSGSLMLIPSQTNNVSGYHSVFHVGTEIGGEEKGRFFYSDVEKDKHVSFNKEGLFDIFKGDNKKIRLFIADVPQINKIILKGKADNMNEEEAHSYLDGLMKKESLGNNNISWPVEKVTYRKTEDDISLGKITLEHFWPKREGMDR